MKAQVGVEEAKETEGERRRLRLKRGGGGGGPPAEETDADGAME